MKIRFQEDRKSRQTIQYNTRQYIIITEIKPINLGILSCGKAHLRARSISANYQVNCCERSIIGTKCNIKWMICFQKKNLYKKSILRHKGQTENEIPTYLRFP